MADDKETKNLVKRDETDLVSLVEDVDQPSGAGQDDDEGMAVAEDQGEPQDEPPRSSEVSRSSALPPPLPPRKVSPATMVVGALVVVAAAGAAIFIGRQFLFAPDVVPVEVPATVTAPPVAVEQPPVEEPPAEVAPAEPAEVVLELQEFTVTTPQARGEGATTPPPSNTPTPTPPPSNPSPQ